MPLQCHHNVATMPQKNVMLEGSFVLRMAEAE